MALSHATFLESYYIFSASDAEPEGRPIVPQSSFEKDQNEICTEDGRPYALAKEKADKVRNNEMQ